MAIRFVSKATVKNKLPRSSNIWDGTAVYNPFTLVGNYDALATVTVPSGGLSSITFAGIPQTGYSHLQIRAFWKSSSGAELKISINSDTTDANYYRHYLQGSGSAAEAGGGVNRSIMGYNGSTTYFEGTVSDILDYTNTNKNKVFRTLWGYDANGSGYIGLTSALWSNTSAINSINLSPTAGTFSEYSSFALYGVKA
jgi:hypothetical protein